MIKKGFTPYYLGDDMFSEKHEEYFSHPNQYNTVIFGSSRMYRHLNPAIIDSSYGKAELSTYNFASPGTFNPATYYLYENFLDEIQENTLKYVFIELQPLANYQGDNCLTTEASYWNSTKFLYFTYNYIQDSSYDGNLVGELYSCYLSSYLFGFYDFSPFLNVIRPPSMGDLWNDGYISIEEAMRIKSENLGLKKRWDDFHSDTTSLTERVRAAQIADSLHTESSVNRYHLNYVLDLIQRSEEKGLDLVFVLQPRLTSIQYEEILPIASVLPKKNVITMHSYRMFEEFYLSKYSFDVGHLNTEGSTIFTKYFVEQLSNR
jgi:hypothetical protein